jgi:hypothetical protein
MADATVPINVWVVDRGDEASLRWRRRVAVAHLDIQEECTAGVCALGRTYTSLASLMLNCERRGVQMKRDSGGSLERNITLNGLEA